MQNTKQRTNSSIKKKKQSKWIVPALSSVPFGYGMKRCFRQVKHSSPQEVAERISNCLRIRSIQAKYDTETALIKCKNSDFVQFHVRLFAGKPDNDDNDNDDDDDSVTVHVHRMKGCGFSFRDDSFAILDAACGVQYDESSDLATNPHTSERIQLLSETENQVLDEKMLEGTLMNSASQLQSDRREMQIFALQHIRALTDTKKTSRVNCEEVAKMVMDNISAIRESLSSFLVSGNTSFTTRMSLSERNHNDEVEEEMKNYCLLILSNSIDLICMNGTLVDVVKRDTQWFLDILIPLLINEISSHEECTHNAALAAKILSILIGCSSEIRSVIGDDDLATFETAEQFGFDNHLKLQEEMTNVIHLLDSSSV